MSAPPGFEDLFQGYYIEGLHRGWNLWEAKLAFVLAMFSAAKNSEQLSRLEQGPMFDLLRTSPPEAKLALEHEAKTDTRIADALNRWETKQS
jgi:hypothetical protein